MNFYDRDRELAEIVARFVAEGLGLGERVVVVATGPHRAATDEALRNHGVDASRARDTGRLVTLDAAATLRTFMRDNTPDPDLFVANVGSIIAGARADGSTVRVFGEMVALLWHDSFVAAAIELESLWNDLMAAADFTLLCAYPTSGLNAAGLRELGDVCSLHSAVIPPSSYAAGPSSEDAVRAQYSQVFVPAPEAVAAVRRFVAGVLERWRQEQLMADAVLVASELATNAVMHADSPFRISVDRSIGVVCIAMQDAGDGRAERRSAAPDDLNGRGMAIVEAVSRRWGCHDLPGGKVVWAELAATRGSQSSAC